jgi:hypothetical protein
VQLGCRTQLRMVSLPPSSSDNDGNDRDSSNPSSTTDGFSRNDESSGSSDNKLACVGKKGLCTWW